MRQAMKIIRLGLLITTICAVCVSASAQANQCYVATYRRDPVTKKQASARIALGTFAWQADQPLAGVVQDQSTGVYVAVRGERAASPGRTAPRETIRIAISFIARPGDAFDEAGAAEAEATYDERWRRLSVSKNIKIADALYTYYVDCDRSNKRHRPDVW